MSLSERRFKCLRDVVGIVVVALISLCITACGANDPRYDPNSEETAQARQSLQEEIDKVDGDESLLDSSRYTSTAINSFKDTLEKAKEDVNDPGADAHDLEQDLTYLKGSVTGLNLSTEKLKEQEAEEQEQEAKRQQEKAEKEQQEQAEKEQQEQAEKEEARQELEQQEQAEKTAKIIDLDAYQPVNMKDLVTWSEEDQGDTYVRIDDATFTGFVDYLDSPTSAAAGGQFRADGIDFIVAYPTDIYSSSDFVVGKRYTIYGEYTGTPNFIPFIAGYIILPNN